MLGRFTFAIVFLTGICISAAGFEASGRSDTQAPASAPSLNDQKTPDPPPVIVCPANEDLDSAKKLIRNAHYEEAEKLARQIVAHASIPEKHESFEAAEGLRYLVDVLLRQAKEKEPETGQLAQESEALSRRVFGDASPCYAAALANLGTYSLRMDKFDDARKYWQQCVSIYRSASGAKSPELASMLSRMAALEGITGHFAEVRSLMEEAVAIVNSLPVIDNPEIAPILDNYGLSLFKAGDLLGAEAATERGLEIRERTLDSPHPQIANSLMNLGNIRENLGDFASARDLFEKALRMVEQTVGPNHRQVAQVVSSLALLLADTGRPDLAIPYQERAVTITRAARGEDNSEYWQTVSELGLYRARTGDWQGALNLLRPALAAQENKFGPYHQEVGATLLRLAAVEAESGDAVSAADHYQRAIEAYQHLFGPTHPHIGDALDGLAHLKYASGDLEGADQLFRQALEFREGSLGANHPDVAELHVDLARLDWSRGDGADALQESFKSEEILRTHFGHVIRGFSEREALAYQKIRQSGLGIAYSVLAGTPSARRTAESVEQVWNATLRSRAIVLDQMASRHEFAASHRAGKTADLARDLAAAANRLARLAVQGPNVEQPQKYRADFEKALAEKERLEHDLAEATEASGGDRVDKGISLDGIRAALPPGSGLVAYVEFLPSRGPDTKVSGTRSADKAPSDEYGVLMLTKERPGSTFVDLGSAASIDALISRWRKETVPANARSLTAHSQAEKQYRLAGAALRAKIWDPIAPKISGLKQVFVVPDGNLALVSLAALPSQDPSYLLETSPIFHYLSTERDILKPREDRESSRALVVGGPEFDMSPPVAAATLEPSSPVLASSDPVVGSPDSFRGVAPGCKDFQSLKFAAIPGARNEATAIGSQLLQEKDFEAGSRSGVGDFVGSRASEPSFKQWAPGSSILHLATHGFFLGSGCDNVLAGGAAPGLGVAAHQDPLRGGIFLGNPLLLSGLALAGANQRSLAGPARDDGILTSEEIASLDLSSAQWVVLSACETGIGSIQSGEGVLGLRRAFQLAGARTIIMSLWKVDDQATLEWMQRLYRGRGEGLSTAEAVRRASLASLEERRAKGKSTHPFYWGAFVAVGDWR